MNPLINELIDGFRQSKWLPLITAYAGIASIIGPGPHFALMHIPFIIACLFLMARNKANIDIYSFLLLMYLPLNILLSHPDPVFKSWSRLGLFSLVFIFASPFLKESNVAVFRQKLLSGLLLVLTIISIASFFCFFLGINYMGNASTGKINAVEIGSGFGGLTIQSIALGQFSGMSILYLTYRALRQEEYNRKYYWVAIAILAFLVLITSSRSALLSTIAGVLIMIYQTSKSYGKLTKMLFVFVVGAMLTFPLWEDLTLGLQEKRVSDLKSGRYGSRTPKWTARWEEFVSSPIIGIGFASQDPNGKDYYDTKTGTIEPGSSWLCVLSMTGIIGFSLVVMFFVKSFKYLSSHTTPYNVYLMALLTFICLHMFSEGYIFAGGGAGCFIAWLVIGAASDAPYLEEETT